MASLLLSDQWWLINVIRHVCGLAWDYGIFSWYMTPVCQQKAALNQSTVKLAHLRSATLLAFWHANISWDEGVLLLFFKPYVTSGHFYLYWHCGGMRDEKENNNLGLEFWWNCGTVEPQQIRKWHLPIQIGSIAIKARPLTRPLAPSPLAACTDNNVAHCKNRSGTICSFHFLSIQQHSSRREYHFHIIMHPANSRPLTVSLTNLWGSTLVSR